LCGWLAGLRLSEAAALQRDPTDKAPCLDLARDRIVLPAEFVKAVRDQWVPLDPELRDALVALPHQGRRFLQLEHKDGTPIKQSALSLRVVTLAKKAGVKLTYHSLRKGFGCWLAGRVSAHVLQRLMRHSNIATTRRFYANIDAAVEEAILGPGRNKSRNKAGLTSPTAMVPEEVNPDGESVSGE
jgi:integrase